jgi:hypothetical protein
MSSSTVIKVEIDLEFLPGFFKRGIRFQIYFLALDVFPETAYLRRTL